MNKKTFRNSLFLGIVIAFQSQCFGVEYSFESLLIIKDKNVSKKIFHVGIKQTKVEINGYQLASGTEPLVQKDISSLAFPTEDHPNNCAQAKYRYKFKRPDQKQPSIINGCVGSQAYERLNRAFLEIQGYSHR